jgi:predicted dinucleotide-binding enzyme
MTTPFDQERIAVLGTGNVGRTLAAGWRRAGASVMLAGRDPERTALAAAESHVSPATPAEALREATIVVLAVPATGIDEAVSGLGSLPAGTLIVDATNGRVDGRPTPISARSKIEAAAPQTVYVRAFNSTAWENMADPVLDGRPVDLFWCGPQGTDTDRVVALAETLGMRPVRLGDADKTEALDALTSLWFALVFESGHGRRIAFGVQGLETPSPRD